QYFCAKHQLGGRDVALAGHAEAIKAARTRAISDVIEIGRLLTEAKVLCGGHGNWSTWLEREFGWTDRTALNFMHVYQMAPNPKRISDLNLPLISLNLLAAPSTPETVRQDVIERAASGEELSHAQVKAAVDEAKP